MEARPNPFASPTDPAAPAAPTSSSATNDPSWSASVGHNGHTGQEPSPGDALREGFARLGEVREYLTYYVATKVDGVKVSVRNVVIYAVLGVLGLMVGGAVLATTGVLLLLGIAHGLTQLFGGPGYEWLGELVTAVLILGAMAAATVFGLKWLSSTSRSRLFSKYEDRQRRQRYEYGHDVSERATAAAREQAIHGSGHN